MFPYVIILKLKDNKPIKFIECEWLKFVKNIKTGKWLHKYLRISKCYPVHLREVSTRCRLSLYKKVVACPALHVVAYKLLTIPVSAFYLISITRGHDDQKR